MLTRAVGKAFMMLWCLQSSTRRQRTCSKRHQHNLTLSCEAPAEPSALLSCCTFPVICCADEAAACRPQMSTTHAEPSSPQELQHFEVASAPQKRLPFLNSFLPLVEVHLVLKAHGGASRLEVSHRNCAALLLASLTTADSWPGSWALDWAAWRRCHASRACCLLGKHGGHFC